MGRTLREHGDRERPAGLDDEEQVRAMIAMDHPESFDEEELRSCDSMIGTSIRYGSQRLSPERLRQLREIVRHLLLQADFRIVTKEYGLCCTP